MVKDNLELDSRKCETCIFRAVCRGFDLPYCNEECYVKQQGAGDYHYWGGSYNGKKH